MGTHWELKGNIVGTHWEPGKKEKKILPAPPLLPKLKRKKSKSPLSACLGLLIGCKKFLFPKEFLTIFGGANTPCKEQPTNSKKSRS
jgi:hypothetical protein